MSPNARPPLELEIAELWLALARARGLGALRCKRALERLGGPEAVWRAICAGAFGESVAPPRLADLRAELEAIDRIGANLLTLADAEYPRALAAIDDPPIVLTARGRLERLRGPGVALVGSRDASAAGAMHARRLGRELAAAGYVVVSGLARGIDAAAHRGALEESGATVAVIASGVDVAYPRENAELAAEIAERGLILSERPMSAEPTAKQFPKRNRIISGLSAAVVVVEAAERSGTLITARAALEQGREVMAVPGSPHDARHRGANRLIREGARLVETADDIVESLGWAAKIARRPVIETRTALVERRAAPNGPPTPSRPRERSEKGSFESGDASLERARGSVMRVLSPTPMLVDELLRQCEAPSAVVREILLDLELAGKIERHPGNRVALLRG